jgi:hypothetical protein
MRGLQEGAFGEGKKLISDSEGRIEKIREKKTQANKQANRINKINIKVRDIVS